MYGIRYHIITLIAVFLALGLGLLLGGTLGDEFIVKEQVQLLNHLEDRYTQAKADNSKLHKQTTEWEQKAQQLEQVMSQVGGHYVRDRLIGKKVAVLQLDPEASLAPLVATLEQAGAQVTATVQTGRYQDLIADRARLQTLKAQVGLPADAGPAELFDKMAARFADELFFKPQQDTPVLDALKGSNLLTVSGGIGVSPDAVVVIGGAGNRDEERLKLFDVPLLQALNEHDLQVVGAEQSGVEHSGVATFREFGLSTVDNIDQVTGRVALIDVLGGAKGHFGTKKTAEALLPQVKAAKEVSTQ